MKTLVLMIPLSFCAAAASAPAWPQYPAKPIRLIVPVPAGGASDAAARGVGQALSKSLGQPVVVDNRPGAGGAIGAQTVLAASADGHTLLWGLASMTAIPLLLKTPPFNSLSEFTPVSLIGRFTFALVVHPGVPANSVVELINHARANPGKLSFATGPYSEFMAATQFMKATGVSMLRVPYKGGAQALPDVLAGRVQIYFTPVQLVLPYAKEGRLRMLATLLPQRSAVAPDVPSLVESGVKGVNPPAWQAIFAPPKTPREIVERLSRDLTVSLREPDLRKRLEQQALTVEGQKPEALAAVIAEDFAAWQAFVRENDIPRE